jgi:type II secretory ATPase GspE/PulE/Tfp pilus assembly ATPase PilB-like protein
MVEISTFEWPKPPYYNFVSDSKKPFPEDCIVELLSNGTPLVGLLIRFSPEESKILFQRFGHDAQQIIEFNQIKSLQLLWKTTLIPTADFLKSRAEEVFHAPEKQPYQIIFTDGSMANGETISYVKDESGLYLFALLKDKKIEKHFIPNQSIKHYQIGLQIGDMLVEDNHVTSDDIDAALHHQQTLKAQRIGDYLNENKIISAEQLHRAITLQKDRPVLKLGEALKQLELITDEQLAAALSKQKENRGVRLGEILVQMGIVDERALKGTLAKKLGFPYVSLTKFNFDPNAVRLIDVTLARKYKLMPLCIHEGMLVVAFEDPMNIKAVDEVRFVTQMNVLPSMASSEDIQYAINEFYTNSIDWDMDNADKSTGNDDGLSFMQSSGDDLANKLFEEDKSSSTDIEDKPIEESDNTLVQLVNKMIIDAVNDKASDIHIETYPGKKNTVVRFRKDGILMPYLKIPANFCNALISRIKIMCQLDISERRKPQDGKLDFKQFGPKKVELRVATIPTSNGMEDIVMRVLSSSKPRPVTELGLDQNILNSLLSIIEKPYGLILVCGPTGSGKTTTLHSLLGHINTPERKIWTAEDPIEITQAGLRQVQVNAKIGWTFANAMRSFLRADPDVIMVGEMRDEETTKIGIEASLTGHLVLSTLHTNSAPESIVRMLELGMDPFNFADALLGVLAQRLARSLCSHCKEAYEPAEVELQTLADEYVQNTGIEASTVLSHWHERYTEKGKFVLYKTKGCKSCNNTGYSGRIGIYELMTVSPALRSLIQKHAPVAQLVSEALSNGMVTLKQDGISKVLQGQTDISQVRAVCS